MPCEAPPRISTPASAGPTVGAKCHGKVTADVWRVGLDVGPLLRGGIKERVDMDKRLGGFTQVSAPLCLEVKTYSCFLLFLVSALRGEESARRLQRCCELSNPARS